MAGGPGAILGLLCGVLLAFAGGEALSRGSRALLAGAAGLAAFAAVLCSAVPEYAFAMRASAINLPGAAVGAIAGSFAVNALIAAVVASSGSGEPVRGARGFAVFSALAATVLITAAFDGRISRSEGELMVAAALFVAWRAARLESGEEVALKPKPLAGIGWLAFGVALTAAGTWLALEQVFKLSGGLQGPDLTVGLIALGIGAALPETVAAVRAARRGEGAQAFVNIATGASLTLLGALGAAAMVRPVVVYEAFLGVPTAAVVVSALVLLLLAFTRVKAPKIAVALGAMVYLGFLVAFVRNAG